MGGKYKKAELLSPAGNFEKLKSAVIYGADAVYLAGKNFGMRAASTNFDREELAHALEFCHKHGVKLYVTVNVMPHTSEYGELREYIKFLDDIRVDAVIVADIGVVMLVREIAPNLEIHISTQASAVSAQACIAWHKLGASRVVLARELSLADIREIRANIPDSLELETFVHGAMCIAYSGRCLLSNYFTGRDANHGACAQSCRWKYSPTAIDLGEANRPNIPSVVTAEQDPNGETFFMASKDMCMIRHIPELEEAGISSYKIEGRVKSAYYTAVVTNTYRLAIDEYRRDPSAYKFNEDWANELDGVSHREYGTGFFFGPPHEDAACVKELGYIREKAYIATAVEDSTVPDADGMYDVLFIQRNKLVRGDTVEMISPGKIGRAFIADDLRNEENEAIESAPHPSMYFRLKVPFEVHEGDIIRLG
ncbi:MAG: U32 family peptidase [Ruminococcaceae bacterium]|nr:U32 family peptidase [Oscillospiraceae bacterium]